MKEKRQRLTVFILVLALASLLAFGSVYLPVFAQDDEAARLFTDMGEGDNRVLSSNWVTIAPGEQHTYNFAYDGDEQPITVWMNAIPAGGVAFEIWTDERLEQLSEDSETPPLGQGTAMSEGSGFTNWQGGSPEAETYYVVVNSTSNAAARYLLNVSSPALAADQPGAVESTETGTPIPTPTPTPTTATQTTTGTATADIATVTTNVLNVREGPSTDFPIITSVPNGTQLTVLGRNEADTWIMVRLEDGTEGWVTRSLTDYIVVHENIISEEDLAEATPTTTITSTTGTTTTGIIGTAVTTVTTEVTETTTVTESAVTLIEPITDTATVENEWQVLAEGEMAWYSFEYRGNGLPLTIWLDLEPFDGAEFTVVDEESAQAMLAGTTTIPTDVLGRGMANPVAPGYLFWQANLEDAGVYYVMVENTGTDDLLYALHALGPGLERTIAETGATP